MYDQKTYNILVVEDEFIIADTIERHLVRNGHAVTGKAISCRESIGMYESKPPDLALVDIRLSGQRTGIDFAYFLREQQRSIPFIYLTSQMDPTTLDLAKATFPAGYLTKPVQMTTLLSTIAVTMHNHSARKKAETVTLKDGKETHLVAVDTISYIQADHVYAHVHLVGHASLVLRTSLSEMLGELPEDKFIQPHRSYVVNRDCVTRYERECLHLGEVKVPISRSRRPEILSAL